MPPPHYDVSVVTAPARDLAVTRFRAGAGEVSERMGPAFARVATHLERHGQRPDGPAVALFTAVDGGFEVAAGFAVDRAVPAGDDVEMLHRPQQRVATTSHTGPYGGLPDAYAALATAAAGQGLRLDDTAGMWEEYLSPPETPPEQTRTDVYWPVRAA